MQGLFCYSRKYFPNSKIALITNGILLPKQEDGFWESCRDNQVQIQPTKYPIKVDWDSIKAKCADYEIFFKYYQQDTEGVIKKTYKFVLEPKGNLDPHHSFVNCFLANNCVQFRNGKLFTCCIAADIRFFNQKFNQNLQVTEADYIDIYKARDYTEILQFLAKPIPFCRYCNVTKMKIFEEWKTSKKEIGEYLE